MLQVITKQPVITDISWQCRSDSVNVVFFQFDRGAEEVNEIQINHDDLRGWLESGTKLEWDDTKQVQQGGEIVQVGGVGEYGYIEYVEDVMTPEVMHEYLTAKGLTNLKYKPD